MRLKAILVAVVAVVALSGFASDRYGAAMFINGTEPPATSVGQGTFWFDTNTNVLKVVATTGPTTWTTLGSGGGASWGAVTGTLSAQTDLQTALDAKQASGTYATGTGTASGTNTGDQTITLTGNVTGTGTGSFAATIANGAVTLAKMADMATGSVFYRKTAGTGVPEIQTLATLKTDLSLGNVDNTTDANKPVSSATQTALNLKANLAGPTFTGTVTLPAGQALVTPAIGAATGTSLATTGDHTTSGGKIGYTTGAGGTVTQLTSKATGVTLSKSCGDITMNGAALAAATIVSFTLTNTVIAAPDVVILNHVTTGTRGAYGLNAQAAAGSAVVYVRNNTAGSLSEAIVIRFCVVKGAVS